MHFFVLLGLFILVYVYFSISPSSISKYTSFWKCISVKIHMSISWDMKWIWEFIIYWGQTKITWLHVMSGQNNVMTVKASRWLKCFMQLPAVKEFEIFCLWVVFFALWMFYRLTPFLLVFVQHCGKYKDFIQHIFENALC